MIKKLVSVFLALLLAFGLAACRKTEEAPVTTEAVSAPEETLVYIISTPKISEEYNSIDDADRQEKAQIREELLAVAEGCRDIYQQAEKGRTINVVLDAATVRAMVERIGQMGYPAADAFGELDMRCPQPIVDFGETISGAEDTSVSYFNVYNDGQISVYHLARRGGVWYLIAMSAVWDREGEPSVLTEGRYAIGDVQFTEKGWLIYNRDTGSFDDNQRTNTNSHVFVRVLPYDSVKRSLAQKYVEPVGYFENNLFTTTWTQADLGIIDFNSLFSALFGMYMGTGALSASNAADYYSTVGSTRLFIVPTDSFESIVRNYFNIDSSVLKNISDYSYALNGYFFLGYQPGMYNVTPRIPQPEVVDYWYNSDGSLTLRIDAVNQWYGTDRAFTHELTVMDTGSGGFKYISNTLYTDENSIVPSGKLSDLLDIERSNISF